MKERLKKLRKELDLTQQEFADRIGIKRNSYANYEIGRNTPIDAIILSICREFNVSEDWLRNGAGEMFRPLSRDDEIEKAVRSLLDGESDSFKNRLIQILAGLSPSDWERLEKEASKLFQSRFPTSELAASKETVPIENDDDHPMTIAEAEEAYIKSRLEIVKKKERSVSSTTTVKEKNKTLNRISS